jgi:CheY-like chemotaxis protein
MLVETHMMPTLPKTILIVEDDEPKLNAITSMLDELSTEFNVITASSVASAVALIADYPIAFAILDMSLPAFDILSDAAGGGQPQGFGGRDVLRFLEDCWPKARAVILTQYEEFKSLELGASRQDFRSMAVELEEEFELMLLDVIYYSGQRGAWRERLAEIINSGVR